MPNGQPHPSSVSMLRSGPGGDASEDADGDDYGDADVDHSYASNMLIIADDDDEGME